MNEKFGIKDLTDVVIRAREKEVIGDRVFHKGEPIIRFDRIQLAMIDTPIQRSRAEGGKRNIAQVLWNDTREVKFRLQEGVCSKLSLALLSHANVIESDEKKGGIAVPQFEYLDNNAGYIETTFPLAVKPIFVYSAESGESLDFQRVDSHKIKVVSDDPVICVDYHSTYEKKATILQIGKEHFKSYVQIEGKMAYVDKNTGGKSTSIFIIPKARVENSLSMRLGSKAEPILSSFNVTGYPENADSDVFEWIFL